MGLPLFARRYSGARFFFLFLRLLRCFSLPGSLRMTMDSSYGDSSPCCRVSPFGYPRINGYLLLPAAFRSLSRPSSAPGAKASALRPLYLDLVLRWEHLQVLGAAQACLYAVADTCGQAFPRNANHEREIRSISASDPSQHFLITFFGSLLIP